jgi:hypothetical protein
MCPNGTRLAETSKQGDSHMQTWSMRLRTWRSGALAAVLALAAMGVAAAPAAADDLVGPTADSLTITSFAGGDIGFIRQGARIYVCANNVVDGGDTPTGVKSATMDISSFGLPYPGYDLTKMNMSNSPVKTGICRGSFNSWEGDWPARKPLPEGPYAYSVTMTDFAGNSTTMSDTGTMDNTPPKAKDVQSSNGGTTVGKAELGDTITFSFNEIMSRMLGDDAPTNRNVVVHIDNSGSNDLLSVWVEGNQRQDYYVGTVKLGGDYVSANTTFGATGVPSTLVRGSTPGTNVITLGTPSGPTRTVTGSHTMVWSPSPNAMDRPGNPLVVSTITESGLGDPDF